MFDHMNRNRKQQNSFCGTSSTLQPISSFVGWRVARSGAELAEAISLLLYQARPSKLCSTSNDCITRLNALQKSQRAAVRPVEARRSHLGASSSRLSLASQRVCSSPTPNATVYNVSNPLPYALPTPLLPL